MLRIALLPVIAFFTTLLLVDNLRADTITSFEELPASPSGTLISKATGSSPPPSTGIASDLTFRFTMTTPSRPDGDYVIVEFGGGLIGTSLFLEGDRLVFRSGGKGSNTLLYVTSEQLAASTQYDVTGSLYMNPDAGADRMQLYIDEMNAVDSSYANHNPAVDIGSQWAGRNDFGFGVVGGSRCPYGHTCPAGEYRHCK